MRDKVRSHIDQLEQVVNGISDEDREWWPFVFLRPSEYDRMKSRNVLALAVLQGVFAGMLGNAFIALTAGRQGPALAVWVLPVCMTLLLFAVYRSTLAYFWNRRAHRLSGAVIARRASGSSLES